MRAREISKTKFNNEPIENKRDIIHNGKLEKNK
jgi:hypothetical protein